MDRYDALTVINCERAAEIGDHVAQYHLGLMYVLGEGVAPDYVIAHKWLDLAAMGGSTEARALKAELGPEMTGEEIARARRLARDWKPADGRSRGAGPW